MAGRKFSQVGESKHLSVMLYSWPGFGKTKFIGSGGKDYKTLILRPPTDHTDSILGSGVHEEVLRTWDDIREMQEYIRHEGHEWDWIWLDGISLLQEWGLDDVWEAAKLRKPSRGEFGKDKGEYGINMDRLAEFIRHTVGADTVNFGVTALPMIMEDPATGDEKLWPWIQGKNMSSRLCAYMNIVAYLEVKESTKNPGKKLRVLRTYEHEDYYAKDQVDAFGGRLQDPTMQKFVDAISKVREVRKATPTRRRTTTKG